MPKEVLSLLNANSDSDFFIKVTIWASAILAPLYDLVGSLFLLIAIDLAVGIWASVKKGEGFQLNKLINTAAKICVYTLMLLACWIVQSKFMAKIPLLSLGGGFLALTELRSIAYNFKEIFGVDIWTYIRAAISRQAVKEIQDKK